MVLFVGRVGWAAVSAIITATPHNCDIHKQRSYARLTELEKCAEKRASLLKSQFQLTTQGQSHRPPLTDTVQLRRLFGLRHVI